jgi:hypothetical protein
MLDRTSLLTLFDGTLKNLVVNLDFIPEDKQDWKPAPDANSTLEIINHLGSFLGAVSTGLNPAAPAFTPVTNLEEAKQVIASVGEGFRASVCAASPEKLSEMFIAERSINYAWIATVGVVDTIHHAGQIAYIQTMLGDKEFHGSFADMKAYEMN